MAYAISRNTYVTPETDRTRRCRRRTFFVCVTAKNTLLIRVNSSSPLYLRIGRIGGAFLRTVPPHFRTSEGAPTSRKDDLRRALLHPGLGALAFFAPAA